VPESDQDPTCRTGTKAREFTGELWAALGKHGCLGVNIPEEHGGGAGLTELAIVCEETGAQGCPLLPLLVSSAISGEVIGAFGTPEQRARWLPRLASGEGKIVFAITEPDAGSNTHRLGTAAVRDGEQYVLRGQKYYISGVDACTGRLEEADDAVTRRSPPQPHPARQRRGQPDQDRDPLSRRTRPRR
jgi:alkylation response protein AidB-like acyl-CoA dehydrogenase